MHWHTPSEHTVDGKHYDAEVHLVSMDADGNRAGTGIFFSVEEANGVDNPFVASFIAGYLDRATADTDPAKKEIDMDLLT